MTKINVVANGPDDFDLELIEKEPVVSQVQSDIEAVAAGMRTYLSDSCGYDEVVDDLHF
jgi:hypothetical protein